MITYTRDQLIVLRSLVCLPSIAVRRAYTVVVRPRGRRAGHNLQRAIPVRITSRSAVERKQLPSHHVLRQRKFFDRSAAVCANEASVLLTSTTRFINRRALCQDRRSSSLRSLPQISAVQNFAAVGLLDAQSV